MSVYSAGAIVGNVVSGNWYSPCGDYLTCYNAAGVLVVASDGVQSHDVLGTISL